MNHSFRFKYLTIVITVTLFLLSSCKTSLGSPTSIYTLSVSPSTTSTLTPAFPNPHQTELAISTLTNTPVFSTFLTEIATITSSPLPTATFNPINIKTHTPAPVAQCPKAAPDLIPDFSQYLHTAQPLDMPVLDFLNAGGLPQEIDNYLISQHYANSVYQSDMTGDGIPEFAISILDLSIFGCREGKYELLMKVISGVIGLPPKIVAVKDLNLDNTPELLIMASDCGMNPCQDLWIYEWDGKEFVNLVGESKEDSIRPVALFDWELRDIDQNGTVEIILKEHIPVWSNPSSFRGVFFSRNNSSCHPFSSRLPVIENLIRLFSSR